MGDFQKYLWELSISFCTVSAAVGHTVKFKTEDYPLALLWKWGRRSNFVTSSKQSSVSQELISETLLMICNTNWKRKEHAILPELFEVRGVDFIFSRVMKWSDRIKAALLHCGNTWKVWEKADTNASRLFFWKWKEIQGETQNEKEKKMWLCTFFLSVSVELNFQL